MTKKHKIVIIGAGFGGVTLAQSLRNSNLEILLLDQNNYHNFQPLMYQIATGGLEPYSIAYPVRRIFRNRENIRFRMTKVKSVNTDAKKVKTSVGSFKYDFLIIATGSKSNFYDFDSIKNILFPLKSIPDALNMRSFIFQNLEKSLTKQADESLEEILNIAIVGGGPAGIELAGALAEMKQYVIPKDFPDLDISKLSINLYQSAPKLLKTMSEEASQKTLVYLQNLGINVCLNSRVTNYDGDKLSLSDGSSFPTDTLIWTAGVKGAPIKGLPKKSMSSSGRVLVDAFNRVMHTESIFAIGDVAAHISEENPRGLPMLAPVAKQQGKLLAKNIIRMMQKKTITPFEYNDKGVMATIGRKKAVVDLPKWKFQGTFAWFLWMFVHIMSLVGFRNKFVAVFDWIANYLTYDRPLGLILRPHKRK